MSDIRCPVCQSPEHQSFWYWEKEDQLLRQWAMETRTHFSICRKCATIFQNPPVAAPAAGDLLLFGWEGPSEPELPVQETLEWLRQFTRFAQTPGRALEVFVKKKRFEDVLTRKGWTVRALPVQSLLPEAGSPPPPDADALDENETFDLIIFCDALETTARPMELLAQLRRHLQPDGALLVETPNPLAFPRYKKICLTSAELCAFPFQSLIFALYKAGFTNHAAEVCGKIRCLFTPIDPQPGADPAQLVPRNVWEHALYRFQRNYYWAWAAGFLETYLAQWRARPGFRDEARAALRQHGLELAIVRDICGACLLFVQEVDTLRQTIGEDWNVTLGRIFDILKNDFQLFDLLRTGAELPGLGTLPGIERYYYRDKMIFMTGADYFERFFTQAEAAELCEAIVNSGQVACQHLSSML